MYNAREKMMNILSYVDFQNCEWLLIIFLNLIKILGKET